MVKTGMKMNKIQVHVQWMSCDSLPCPAKSHFYRVGCTFHASNIRFRVKTLNEYMYLWSIKPLTWKTQTLEKIHIRKVLEFLNVWFQCPWYQLSWQGLRSSDIRGSKILCTLLEQITCCQNWQKILLY